MARVEMVAAILKALSFMLVPFCSGVPGEWLLFGRALEKLYKQNCLEPPGGVLRASIPQDGTGNSDNSLEELVRMLLVVLFGISLASVVVAGGHLGALGSIRFRYTWAVLVALGIQILIISVIPGADPSVLAGAHLVSYVLIGIFVFMNRSIAGLWLLALGWASNLIVIAANGGIMPTAASATASSARVVAAGEFINSKRLPHPKLQVLGDIFAMPRSWPLHNVFSIGDILVVIGAFVLLHSLCGSRLSSLWSSRRPAVNSS
jgi:hypothetical protein